MRSKTESVGDQRAAFESRVMGMYDQLRVWRAAHPQATVDEIAAEVKAGRRQVLGKLVEELAVQEQGWWAAEQCPEWGGMQYKGRCRKQVVHEEGEGGIERPYYHYPACRSGFSPWDAKLGLVKHSRTPGMIHKALRQAVEIPSYVRATEAAAQAWVKEQKQRLKTEGLAQVLPAIRILFPRGPELPEPVAKAVGYFFHNRHRMHYRSYRQAGLPIGSGTVESAGKTVVQARLKQAGMRWSRPGAQAMLSLRCLLLSDRWHELSLTGVT